MYDSGHLITHLQFWIQIALITKHDCFKCSRLNPTGFLQNFRKSLAHINQKLSICRMILRLLFYFSFFHHIINMLTGIILFTVKFTRISWTFYLFQLSGHKNKTSCQKFIVIVLFVRIILFLLQINLYIINGNFFRIVNKISIFQIYRLCFFILLAPDHLPADGGFRVLIDPCLHRLWQWISPYQGKSQPVCHTQKNNQKQAQDTHRASPHSCSSSLILLLRNHSVYSQLQIRKHCEVELLFLIL